MKAYMMTYQTASEHFAARIPARGQSISTAPFLNARAGLAQITGLFSAISDYLIKMSEASARVKTIEALHAKSDGELAQMGLKREDIARHVFKDMYYI